MADFLTQRHIGDLICPKPASALFTQAASAPAQLTGTVLDRLAFQGPGLMPRTVDLDIWFATAAAAALNQVLSISWILQHAPDGTTFTTFATQAATAYNTAGPSAVLAGIARMTLINADEPNVPFGGFNLPPFIAAPSLYIGPAQRYLRLLWTPSYAISNADSFSYAVTAVFAGFSTLQAPIS
ncbi:MAG: hypothetical protein ACREC9_15055 [Methylocella sp.]